MVQRLGFDKSSYDGRIDWSVAKEKGIQWMTIRASYGLTTDTLYEQESNKALGEGIYCVPYHWYVPRKYSPVDQANKFLSVARHSNMPPMLDLEDYLTTRGYAGIATKELKIWLDTVSQAVGTKPIIYTARGYVNSYLTTDTWLSEYPLMIANYEVGFPLIPKPWTPDKMVAWQFRDLADAKYYGFMDAKGCALQLLYKDVSYEWNLNG